MRLSRYPPSSVARHATFGSPSTHIPAMPVQFVPLFGVVGVASMLMGGILVKHFGGATDVAFSKKVRMDHNHQVRARL